MVLRIFITQLCILIQSAVSSEIYAFVREADIFPRRHKTREIRIELFPNHKGPGKTEVVFFLPFNTTVW